MNLYYLLLPLLGLLWTLVAIIISEARQHNIKITYFYLTGSILSALLLLAVNIRTGIASFFHAQCRITILCFAFGAVFNGMGQAISMANLRQNGRALAYSIPLLAFLLPYFWSVFFWSQHFSWQAGTGLLIIIAAILFLTMKKDLPLQNSANSTLPFYRVMIAVAAMIIIGIGQVLMAIPTQFPKEQTLSPWAGASLIQIVNAIFFLIWILVEGHNSFKELKRACRFGLFWGICAAASFCVLFFALRALGEMQQAGIVFPTGCSITILLYSIFTSLRFREKLTWSQYLAFILVSVGIFLIKL